MKSYSLNSNPMRKFLTFCMLFISSLGFFQNSDSEIIYSLVINNFEESKIIAIKDSTSIDMIQLSQFPFDHLDKSFVSLQKETFDSFIERNKTHTKLEAFENKKKLFFITDEEANEIFGHGRGWIEFYNRYGKAQGLLTFSNIGFNMDKTQALVYYGNQSDWLAGAGYLALYEKSNGGWKYVNSIMLWIS